MYLRESASEEARIAAASRRVTELQAAKDARNTAHRRMKRELMEAIMEAVTQCASHRELVQQKLGETRSLFQSRLESLLLRRGMGIAAASAQKSVLSSKRGQQSSTVRPPAPPTEYDQLYLDGMEGGNGERSFNYDVPPSMGGMSPIGMIRREAPLTKSRAQVLDILLELSILTDFSFTHICLIIF